MSNHGLSWPISFSHSHFAVASRVLSTHDIFLFDFKYALNLLEIFTTIVCSQWPNSLATINCGNSFKLLKFFQHFWFMSEEIDRTASWVIINKCNKLFPATNWLSRHWSTYITVYQLELSGWAYLSHWLERLLVHLTFNTPFTKITWLSSEFSNYSVISSEWLPWSVVHSNVLTSDATSQDHCVVWVLQMHVLHRLVYNLAGTVFLLVSLFHTDFHLDFESSI